MIDQVPLRKLQAGTPKPTRLFQRAAFLLMDVPEEGPFLPKEHLDKAAETPICRCFLKFQTKVREKRVVHEEQSWLRSNTVQPLA
jgi:hypothetical protein